MQVSVCWVCLSRPRDICMYEHYVLNVIIVFMVIEILGLCVLSLTSWLIRALVSLMFVLWWWTMPPHSRSHLTYIIVLIGQDGRNAFNFYDTNSCQERFFLPLLFSEGNSKEGWGVERGATHAVIHVLRFRWTITLISDQLFWCAERQSKINSERKAVRDLQCSALINEGLYQLGSHDWCVNISAVTQFGTERRVTPLFTEHKDHKQALATSARSSVNSWAFQRIYGFSKNLNFISTGSRRRVTCPNHVIGFLRNLHFEANK